MKEPCDNCIDNLPNCNAACCRSLTFTVVGLTPDQLDYYQKHGCEVSVRNGTHIFKIKVPMVCPQLTPDNRCGLHGTDEQPKICKDFGPNTEGYTVPEGCIYKKDN